MKTMLVTGGCGFIGSNFIRYVLERVQDYKVINLDKLTYAGNRYNLCDIEKSHRYCFVSGDICDVELVERLFSDETIDLVIHFAAESHVDRSIEGPSAFIETNIVGTFTLLEAAKKAWSVGGRGCMFRDENTIFGSENRESYSNFRFLHISTDEVYGSLGDAGFFTEDTSYDPRSPYSASKASSDHLVSAYHHTYGLPTLITNCSNNYGPYQFPEKLIPLIINNALQGKDLPVYGDGKNVRDWLFVEDHCRAIWKVLEKGEVGQTYNIGGWNEKQNIEIVQTICDILDVKVGELPSGKARRNLIKFVKDRLGHDRRYAIDATKIKNELGWEPSVTFEEGILKTVNWYLENPEWISSVVSGEYQEYYQQMYANR